MNNVTNASSLAQLHYTEYRAVVCLKVTWHLIMLTFHLTLMLSIRLWTHITDQPVPIQVGRSRLAVIHHYYETSHAGLLTNPCTYLYFLVWRAKTTSVVLREKVNYSAITRAYSTLLNMPLTKVIDIASLGEKMYACLATRNFECFQCIIRWSAFSWNEGLFFLALPALF